jgi:DNA-binding transcriptional regulator LsrR (DeoR family)
MEAPMARDRIGKYSDEVIFKVVDLFFRQKKTVKEIVASLSSFGLSRQEVYPLLAMARDKELVKMNPPVEQDRSRAIIEKYACPRDSISVVNVSDNTMTEDVAAVAADRVLHRIKQLGDEGVDPVGLGLGPGRATLDFSRQLASKMPRQARLPKLNLFSISAGAPVDTPQYASSSFFNLYPRHMIDHCVGFFAETVVPCSDFAKIRKRTGVREAFQEKDKISIVVTGMGDIEDVHDLLRVFMERSGVNPSTLKEAGWLGNVQYRPFTEMGPIKEHGSQLRAVTLFELEEFVEMAKTKNRHVVLIARQCFRCGRNHAKAIYPLLRNPALKVWSEIIMDLPTADELLNYDLEAPQPSTA